MDRPLILMTSSIRSIHEQDQNLNLQILKISTNLSDNNANVSEDFNYPYLYPRGSCTITVTEAVESIV